MPTATSSNIFYLYEVAADVREKHLSCYIILLGKLLHRCFLRNIMKSFTEVILQNTIIVGIFSIILSICYCHLVVYYLTKPLWSCVSPFAVRDAVACLVIVSMTQYVENFNLHIPHDCICQRSLKIHSLSLKLYFRTGQSTPYSFPLVS